MNHYPQYPHTPQQPKPSAAASMPPPAQAQPPQDPRLPPRPPPPLNQNQNQNQNHHRDRGRQGSNSFSHPHPPPTLPSPSASSTPYPPFPPPALPSFPPPAGAGLPPQPPPSLHYAPSPQLQAQGPGHMPPPSAPQGMNQPPPSMPPAPSSGPYPTLPPLRFTDDRPSRPPGSLPSPSYPPPGGGLPPAPMPGTGQGMGMGMSYNSGGPPGLGMSSNAPGGGVNQYDARGPPPGGMNGYDRADQNQGYPPVPPLNQAPASLPPPPQNGPFPPPGQTGSVNHYPAQQGYGAGNDRYAPGPSQPPHYTPPNQSQQSHHALPPHHGPPEHSRDRAPPRGDGRGRGRSPDHRDRRGGGAGPRNDNRDRDGRTVEARIQLERRCRTLFVRNVSYEAEADRLRADFERYGQIKTYFDLVKTRGMIFITYYDLRAAEKAREGMHDSQIKNRRIDVHYSLPRADEQNHPADRDSNQGSLHVTVRGQQYLPESDLGGVAQHAGEIKAIHPGRTPDQKIVEYFDARGAVKFSDDMNGRPFQSGTLEMRFIWDDPELQGPPPPVGARNGARDDSRPADGHGYKSGPGSQRSPERPRRSPEPDRHERGGRGRGGRGGGGGGGKGSGGGWRRSGEGPGYGEVRGGRREDRRSDGGGHGPGRDGGHGRRESGDRGGGGGYGDGAAGRYDTGPPSQYQPDDRLEQARKVQDLLASLGNTAAQPPPPPPGGQAPYAHSQQLQGGYPSTYPTAPAPSRPVDPRLAPPPQAASTSTASPYPPPASTNGYGAPGQAPPATSGYSSQSQYPSGHNYGYSAPPSNTAGGPGTGGIPPEVLSLLQANNAGGPSGNQGYHPQGSQGSLGPQGYGQDQNAYSAHPPNGGSQGYAPGYPAHGQPSQGPPQGGYQPNNATGAGAVGNLLAMLNR